MKDQISVSLQNLIEKLSNWFDALIVNLPNIILALLVFIFAYYLSNKISTKVTDLLRTRVRQVSIRSLIGNIISIVIILFGIVLALGILNLDQALNSIIAGAGVAGLAIGLALQGTLSNTFAGITLSVKDDINIGDFVETNGFAGKVESINLRDTKIRTMDNSFVVIPNSAISGNAYKNYSLTRDLRVVLDIGVGYESDLRKVESVARDVIKENFSYREEDIEFYFMGFGDSSIDIQLRFWVIAAEKLAMTVARSNAILLIKERFDQESINIPFPIRTVIMEKED